MIDLGRYDAVKPLKTDAANHEAVFNRFRKLQRKEALLTYWLDVFNEQMHDFHEDWIDLEFEKASKNGLFLHWLHEWGDDSRGTLLDILTTERA
jgi:hypothetical protein